MNISDIISKLLHRTKQVTAITGGNTMSTPTDATNEPLLDLASKIGPVIGLATAALTVATSLGILNQKQSGFLNKGLSGAQAILSVIPAVVAGFGAHAAAGLVARQGRELVSPLSRL